MIRNEIRSAMQTLRDHGIASVVVRFSGGNDEGGADGITFHDAAGNNVPSPFTTYRHAYRTPDGWKVWDMETRSDRLATPAEVQASEIFHVLESPIYDRWGSFAGEFHVEGTCTWDVATGTHRLSGQESVEYWESFDY